MTKLSMKLHFLAATVTIAYAWPMLSHAGSNADIEAGRALFMQKGCFECHGIFGQGSISTGPALAPHPIPLPAMEAYVRDPKEQMPVFSKKILPDDEIARIHAYLDSLPAGRPAESIRLLNGGNSSASALEDSSSASNPVAHGASIYAANCAACHGQSGEGGVGPALIGISGRYRMDGIEARIREPSGIMPRLYPGSLNAGDVEDVARFVASLK